MQAEPSISELFIPFLEEDDKTPLYRKLFRGFQHAILLGKLASGSKLPASRTLATTLGISRNTIKTTYEMLLAEGYIETRHGSGSYVADNLSSSAMPARQDKTSNLQPRELHLSDFAQQFVRNKTVQRTSSRELLSPTQPSMKHFPWQAWQHSLSVATRKMKLGTERTVQGHSELRQQIANYLRVTRGLKCTQKQVMICSGSQHALYLCFSMLINKGDSVLVENPGYQGSHGILAAIGADIIPVATDSQGFFVSEKLTKSSNARVALVTPSRNYPMGYTMSLERRMALLNWAKMRNGWIIEDDYDSEFRFDGPPLTALQGMGGEDHVIYTGTFSRIFHPAIRLGYMVIPEALLPSFNTARSYIDGGVSLLPQLAMADFIASGEFARHVRKMRKLYQERRELLFRAIETTLGNTAQRVDTDGGMHAVFLLPENLRDIDICKQAREQGLGVRALSSHYQKKSNNGLIIGFAGFSKTEINDGINVLRKAILST